MAVEGDAGDVVDAVTPGGGAGGKPAAGGGVAATVGGAVGTGWAGVVVTAGVAGVAGAAAELGGGVIPTNRTVICVPVASGSGGSCPLMTVGDGDVGAAGAEGGDGAAGGVVAGGAVPVGAEGGGADGGSDDGGVMAGPSTGRTTVATTPPVRGAFGIEETAGAIGGGADVVTGGSGREVLPADRVPTGRVMLARLTPGRGRPLTANSTICGGCPSVAGWV